MAIASARGLVETLARSRLLEADQLAELNRTLPSRPGDPLVLARELLQRGWLTAYQVNQLFQGRGGDLLLGHYVLLERLGEGGMGQVVKAREVRLGRIVALKILRKERIVKPEVVQRFYQEIQAAASLSHPNIVHAYDAEQIGDTHVFAMEYVEGTDLARLVKQSGPLPIADACEYVRQAAVGLQHVHEAGMVHRDVKPANLIRAKHDGVVKILDMGLARLRENDDEAAKKRLTTLGVVMGTVDYIAPEQALDSRRADIRSDLYSLGCTLYFLLTGQVPFPVEEPMAKLLAHSCDDPMPLRQLRPEVPGRLAAIVAKLMAKPPADRYQTPAELVADLLALSPGPAAAAAAETFIHKPATAVLVPPVPAPAPSAPRRRSPPRWRRRGIITAVILSPFLFVFLWVHLFRGKEPPPGRPEDNASDDVIVNSLGMKFVRLPEGDFYMGTQEEEAEHRPDELPWHGVKMPRPFYLGAHLVTVGNFRAFVAASGYKTEAEKAGQTGKGQCWLQPGWEQTDAHPVACLTWNDAQAFCDWLSKHKEEKGRRYRLPTEAEWEYACRAGSTSPYYFGHDAKKLGEYAWYSGNSEGQAHPVGQLKPNRWGLYDVHGNLLQWCADYYDGHYYQLCQKNLILNDPSGPKHGDRRVLRGGSWNSPPPACRSARREADHPNGRRHDRGGFRIVLVPPS